MMKIPTNSWIIYIKRFSKMNDVKNTVDIDARGDGCFS